MIDLPSVELLSLSSNPLSHQRHYRLYLILQFPSVKTIDDVFVTQMERERAKMIEDIRLAQDQSGTGTVYMMNQAGGGGPNGAGRDDNAGTPTPSTKVAVLSMSLDV